MDLVLRAVVVFAFVLLLTRVIGKRELGSLQPIDLVLLIVLGDALQQGLTQDDYSLTGAILVVSTIALLQVFTSWIAYRFPRSRPVLEGEPIIVRMPREPRERRRFEKELITHARTLKVPFREKITSESLIAEFLKEVGSPAAKEK